MKDTLLLIPGWDLGGMCVEDINFTIANVPVGFKLTYFWFRFAELSPFLKKRNDFFLHLEAPRSFK